MLSGRRPLVDGVYRRVAPRSHPHPRPLPPLKRVKGFSACAGARLVYSVRFFFSSIPEVPFRFSSSANTWAGLTPQSDQRTSRW